MKAHTIVFGNEKGGTGKSTMLIHVAVSLLHMGNRVGVIDLDHRQRSSGRYLQNRKSYCERNGKDLLHPEYAVVEPSGEDSREVRQDEEQAALQQQIARMNGTCDYIIIDCPGRNTYLSILAHSMADTLITPLNDSFIDLDLIGEIEGGTLAIKRLSHYSEMVWECRKLRSLSQRPPIDWIVTRNRLATLDSRNNQRVHRALESLQKRIMFRYIPGLNERVIYREMFPDGLTLLDLPKVSKRGKNQLSQIAARSELRRLVMDLKLPDPYKADVTQDIALPEMA